MKVTDRRQTRPLVREGSPQRQHSNFQTEYNIWSRVPEWTWFHDILTDWLTDWPSVVTWLWLWLWACIHHSSECSGRQWKENPVSRRYLILDKSRYGNLGLQFGIVSKLSNMWRIQLDSDPRKTALAKASSNYRRQTCLFIREGDPF
jgi:hypothetical protein